jgi:hypothetical protein
MVPRNESFSWEHLIHSSSLNPCNVTMSSNKQPSHPQTHVHDRCSCLLKDCIEDRSGWGNEKHKQNVGGKAYKGRYHFEEKGCVRPCTSPIEKIQISEPTATKSMSWSLTVKNSSHNINFTTSLSSPADLLTLSHNTSHSDQHRLDELASSNPTKNVQTLALDIQN